MEDTADFTVRRGETIRETLAIFRRLCGFERLFVLLFSGFVVPCSRPLP
jgi:hypothetical protein